MKYLGTISDPKDLVTKAYADAISSSISGKMDKTNPTGTGTFTLNTNKFVVSDAGAVSASGSVTASSLIKSGGTSSQFLKADGSVDSNTYSIVSGTHDGTNWQAITINGVSKNIPSGGSTYSAGSGLTLDGTTFKHSNAVSALSSATLKKITYDTEGHITGSSDVTAYDLPSHTHSSISNSHHGTASVTCDEGEVQLVASYQLSASSSGNLYLTAEGEDTDIIFTDGTVGEKTLSDLAADHISTVTVTGDGNAITGMTADAEGAITATKGSTFLTSHQDISGKANLSGGNTFTGSQTVNLGSTGGAALEVVGSGSDQAFILTRTGGARCVLEAGGSIGLFGTKTNHPIQVRTNYTNRMTIGTDGSVVLATDVAANSNTNQVATTKWVNGKGYITGTGTSGCIAKFNGTNTVTTGPAFGTSTTTYLRNDGTWGTPTGAINNKIEYNKGSQTYGDASVVCGTEQVDIQAGTMGNYISLSSDDEASSGRLDIYTRGSMYLDAVGEIYFNSNNQTSKAVSALVVGAGSSVNSHVAVFDGTSGTVVKDSGYTIAKSVPSNADFTNTTYSAGTGLSLSGTTFNHSNSVTALGTAALKKIAYDAQGHITSSSNVTASDLPSHTHSAIQYNSFNGVSCSDGQVCIVSSRSSGANTRAAIFVEDDEEAGRDIAFELDSNTTSLKRLGSTLSISGSSLSLKNGFGTTINSVTVPNRAIQMNGTQILSSTSSTALNLKAGSNVTLTNSSGTVTIAATQPTVTKIYRHTLKFSATGRTLTWNIYSTSNSNTRNLDEITTYVFNTRISDAMWLWVPTSGGGLFPNANGTLFTTCAYASGDSEGGEFVWGNLIGYQYTASTGAASLATLLSLSASTCNYHTVEEV